MLDKNRLKTIFSSHAVNINIQQLVVKNFELSQTRLKKEIFDKMFEILIYEKLD